MERARAPNKATTGQKSKIYVVVPIFVGKEQAHSGSFDDFRIFESLFTWRRARIVRGPASKLPRGFNPSKRHVSLQRLRKVGGRSEDQVIFNAAPIPQAKVLSGGLFSQPESACDLWLASGRNNVRPKVPNPLASFPDAQGFIF